MLTKNKKTKLRQQNFSVLLQAIKTCLLENKGIRSTAREHGIDKSSLQRHVKKVKTNFDDISLIMDDVLLEFISTSSMKIPANMVFSITQEKNLVEYIIKCMNYYYGLSIIELRKLAYQFANKLKIKYPSAWKRDLKAGRMWYYSFMKRHPELTLRTPEQTSMSRVKSFCKQNVDTFFTNLARLLDKFHFESTAIYNMDESGFSTVPSKIGKVIALKGLRRVGKVEAAERGTMVTMSLTVSASGNSIPPLFIFPRKNMQSSFLDNVSPGTVGFANGSGWMCQPDFIRYINHFIKYVKPSTDSPVLLLLDNHTSHLSINALDIAAANGVHILSFPPHCSHKLQPLDVSVFGPIKACYKSQCSIWQKNNANKVLEIRHIAGLVCAALDLVLSPRIIKSGFAASGIAPFNPDIFTDADFIQFVEQNTQAVTVDADVNKPEQRHIVFDSNHISRKETMFTLKTSEASTSQSASVISGPNDIPAMLAAVGPLQGATSRKLSKRGRKPMKSCELTSTETIAALKEKAAAKNGTLRKTTTKTANPPAKRFKARPSTSDDEDIDFCIICLKMLPQKLTAANSINCNTCMRSIHLKCADMRASIYTCKHCDSE